MCIGVSQGQAGQSSQKSLAVYGEAEEVGQMHRCLEGLPSWIAPADQAEPTPV